MKTLIRTWLLGWRIVGRLMLFWIAWLIFSFLMSALGGVIEDKTIRATLGVVAFVCFAPFVAYRAAAVSRVCADIVDEDTSVRNQDQHNA